MTAAIGVQLVVASPEIPALVVSKTSRIWTPAWRGVRENWCTPASPAVKV